VRHIPLALCSAAVRATQGSQTVAHAHWQSGQLDAPPKGAQGVTTDHPVPVTARLAQLLPLSATQYVWPLHITCPPKVLGPTPGVVLHRLYCPVGTDTFKATAATGSAEQTSASAVTRRFRPGDDIAEARGRSVGCVPGSSAEALSGNPQLVLGTAPSSGSAPPTDPAARRWISTTPPVPRLPRGCAQLCVQRGSQRQSLQSSS
jgi:hypothetical protein